jgi:exosortase
MSEINKTENINLPKFFIVMAALLYLVVFNGYATGYEFERASLGWWMWEHWTDSKTEWGFGMLVLPLVGILVWKNSSSILTKEIKPAYYSGFALLLISLFLYFAGYKANERYIGFGSMQLLVGSLVVYFMGWRYFFNIWWLWLIFGMMWPWLFLEGPISFWLQLFMVKLTAGFLNLIGDPAVANGTAIFSKATEDLAEGERYQLNIAGACSGLRSLFALVMIGLIYVYVFLKVEWKRWVLFFCIPIVAIIGNFVRMIMLYLGVINFGSEFAIGEGEGEESAFHIGAGLVVFVIALIALSFLVKVLSGSVLKRKVKLTRVK